MKVNPLQLVKFASLKTSDLTVDNVAEIAKVFGINADISNEQFRTIVSMLRADNVDGLADLASKPELVTKIRTFMRPDEGLDQHLLVCPHCGEYIAPDATIQ